MLNGRLTDGGCGAGAYKPLSYIRVQSDIHIAFAGHIYCESVFRICFKAVSDRISMGTPGRAFEQPQRSSPFMFSRFGKPGARETRCSCTGGRLGISGFLRRGSYEQGRTREMHRQQSFSIPAYGLKDTGVVGAIPIFYQKATDVAVQRRAHRYRYGQPLAGGFITSEDSCGQFQPSKTAFLTLSSQLLIGLQAIRSHILNSVLVQWRKPLGDEHTAPV